MYFLNVKRFNKDFIENNFLDLKRIVRIMKKDYEVFKHLEPVPLVRHDSGYDDFEKKFNDDFENSIVLDKWMLS